ncbi:hypothetical protein [Streptosporangium roseum]
MHVDTLLLQQVLAETAWVRKLADEDRRGLTALCHRSALGAAPA